MLWNPVSRPCQPEGGRAPMESRRSPFPTGFRRPRSLIREVRSGKAPTVYPFRTAPSCFSSYSHGFCVRPSMGCLPQRCGCALRIGFDSSNVRPAPPFPGPYRVRLPTVLLHARIAGACVPDPRSISFGPKIFHRPLALTLSHQPSPACPPSSNRPPSTCFRRDPLFPADRHRITRRATLPFPHNPRSQGGESPDPAQSRPR